ncbi:hypothetical protein, partial [Modestobacter versicolor]|uniref:hypothetical protein n=1 Tax=Modestobacter versicolor TaxID=429133 RepID=UPI0015E8E2B6
KSRYERKPVDNHEYKWGKCTTCGAPIITAIDGVQKTYCASCALREQAQQAAEIEQINDWLQLDDGAAVYGAAHLSDPRTPEQRIADDDWQDEQATREAVRP